MATANEGAVPPSASLPPPRFPPSMAHPSTPRSTPSAPLQATTPPITDASSPRPSPVPRRPALEPTSTLHPPASPPAPEPSICSQDPARGLDEGKEASQHAASLSIYKHQDAEMQSSREKRKVPNVKRAKAPDAKRFKSPLAPMAVKSPGVRLMLSPKLASPSVTPARSLSPAQKSPSQGSSHRKRKLRSRIWTEFEPIYDGQTIVQAKCTHCHKLFKANRDFGTSGCIRHLKSCEGRARLDNILTQMSVDNLSSHDDWTISLTTKSTIQLKRQSEAERSRGPATDLQVDFVPVGNC